MQINPNFSSFNTPNFIDTQRLSFLQLLKEGIPNELEKQNPIDLITDSTWPEWYRRFNTPLRKEKWLPTFSRKVYSAQNFRLGSPRIFYDSRSSTMISNIKPFKNGLHSSKKKKNFFRLPNKFGPENYFHSIRETRIKRYDHKLNVSKLVLYFDSVNFSITQPKVSMRTCLLTGKTYGGLMKVPIELRDPLNAKIAHESLSLGMLPIMTNRGHFIINGSPRLILHQLVRSPGVYFHKKDKGSYADIICNRGVWIRIEVTHNGLMWLRMRNTPKIPMLIILQALGLEHPLLLSKLKSTIFMHMPAPRLRPRHRKLPILKLPISEWIYYFLNTKSKYRKAKFIPNKKTIDRLRNRFQWQVERESLSSTINNKETNYDKYYFYYKFKTRLKRKYKLRDLNNITKKDLKNQKKIERLKNQNSIIENKKITAKDAPLPLIESRTKALSRARLIKFGIDPDKVREKKEPYIHPLSTEGKLRAFKERQALEKMARGGFPFSRYARFLLNYLLLNKKTATLKKEKYMRIDYTASHLHVAFMFLESKFDKNVYDLSEVGRYQLNKKLGLVTPLNKHTLTLDDFICILNYLSLVHSGRFSADNIDDLKNRRVRSSGELIQNQLATGLIALKKLGEREKNIQIFENIFNKTKPISYVFKVKPLENTLRQFFNVNPLSQFLDQVNSLAEITHKRRLSSLGPGGITRETAGMKIRSIHPSHYGRICPIETPEGQNAGLVNSLATYARINKYGFIESPFYPVMNGQIQKNNNIIYLTAAQEENAAIAPPDLKIDNLLFLTNSTVPIKLGTDFGKLSKNDVDFFSISRIQLISIATSLIPFLEHNDANRALMGSNMQRQAVPLLNPEKPMVGTGLEGRVLSDSGSSIQARESGIVTYASSEKIKIFSFFSSKKLTFKLTLKDLIIRNQYLNVRRKYLALRQKKFKIKKDFLVLKRKYCFMKKQYQKLQIKYLRATTETTINSSSSKQFHSGVITYYLQRFGRSNQNTYQQHRPLVHEGQWITKGACLVDCSSSAQGSLAVGKNVMVAYLPWEGYNFEDAILVSERLVYDDLFTSLHVVKHETKISETEFGLEQIVPPGETKGEPKQNQTLTHLDRNGVVKVGTWVKEGDILVHKLSPMGKTTMKSHQKFLYVIFDEELPTFKDTSLRVPKGIEGRVIQIRAKKQDKKRTRVLPNRTKNSKGNQTLKINLDQVTIWIAEKKWLQVGDKMAGRHGNKGIVSKIVPRQDMPYLPDGTPIDMVLNPLGVPSRMNVGQIYECLLGLAGKYLNQTYSVIPFDEVSGAQASRSIVYSKLYEASRKVNKDWLFQPENPGKIKIFDGRTGLPFDQPVTVGQAYMLKLIHLVDEKIHARATGPYTMVTQQPLRGRSQKGGQRFGEMEVWAIEGFGAAYTLQELLTVKSDDLYGREQVLKTFFEKKPIKVGKPESFRVLIRELQALCLKIQIFNHPTRTNKTNNWRSNPVDLNSEKFNLY